MSFKALRDGEPVISLDFNEETWREEKGRQKAGDLEYACLDCGGLVALATSHRGRPFFRHHLNSDCPGGAPMSPEHEQIQVAVYRLCRDLGWTTDIEARGPRGEWTADVLATRDGTTYAFEVQLASITGEELAERSAKYRAAGIVPLWLLRTLPARCPFPVPSRTFTTDWTTLPDPHPSRDTDPWGFSDSEIEERFLCRETEDWSLGETLVYWRELGAVVTEFDPDDPVRDRILVAERATTLAGVVTGTLEGKITGELAAAVRSSYDLQYRYQEREARARAVRDHLVGEIRSWPRERGMEGLRATISRDRERGPAPPR